MIRIQCKVSRLKEGVGRSTVFDSAGSRAAIGRRTISPRTRRPEGFTANCPHMDSGMGGCCREQR